MIKKEYLESIMEEQVCDNNYTNILIGKNRILQLDFLYEMEDITLVERNTSVYNTFEESMVLEFTEFPKVINNRNKILINYSTYTFKKYIPYSNTELFEILYIIRKYMLNKSIEIHISKNNTGISNNIPIIKNNLKKFKNNNIIFNDGQKNFKSVYENIANNQNYIFNLTFSQIKYMFYNNVLEFINFYNETIKLAINSCIIAYKVKTDYYLELILDIIHRFRKYFANVYLVNSKYTPKYNFYIILNNKVKNYEDKDAVIFNKNLYRLSKNPIDSVYIKYINKLYKRTNLYYEIITILETNTNTPLYKIIMDELEEYKNKVNKLYNVS